MKKFSIKSACLRGLFLLIGMVTSFSLISQITAIPDANFEQKLIDLGIDSDGTLNGQILTADAAAVSPTLNVDASSITDLTGIEAFVNITQLFCNNNLLSSLDVSGNTALTSLQCDNNSLTSINISSNTALLHFSCHSNFLNNLDVSANTALLGLSCYNNPLGSLDVTNNTALTHLTCLQNSLTSLDVSSNTALTQLNCHTNSLTSLDVTNNTALTYLQFDNNAVTSLDITNNTALIFLLIPNNSLSSLDVTNNTALTHLVCGNNPIGSLDVSSNTALNTLHCGNTSLNSLDVSANTALVTLTCSGNLLGSLDVSNNPVLTTLICAGTSLTSLDVSNNPALANLQCHFNAITSLDLSANPALFQLNCSDNQITSLDLSANTALTLISPHHNPLTCLDVKNGNNSIVTYFYAKASPSLFCINVDDASFANSSPVWNTGIDAWAVFSENCPCGNQPLDCSAATIANQNADANCQATISAADVTGVTDPNEDPLTITLSPTTLSLGANSVTVTADDGNGGTCSNTIIVNVVDNDSDGDGIVDCLDNCINSHNPGQEDSDCDDVGDACDVCPGGNDSVDSDGDGTPDCADWDGINAVPQAWLCGNNNDKVLVCHIPPGNPGNRQNICVSPNAVPVHLADGDFLGPCDEAYCNGSNMVVLPGNVGQTLGSHATLSVFPNPASGKVHLDWGEVNGPPLRIEMHNALGQQVFNYKLADREATHLELDLMKNNIGEGLYIVSLHTLKEVLTAPLIISKNK